MLRKVCPPHHINTRVVVVVVDTASNDSSYWP